MFLWLIVYSLKMCETLFLIALFQRTISLEVGRVRCHVNVVLIARFGRELKRGLVVQHAPTLQVSNDLRIVQILLVMRCVG